MAENIVTYKQAVDLAELGFDYETFLYYQIKTEVEDALYGKVDCHVSVAYICPEDGDEDGDEDF